MHWYWPFYVLKESIKNSYLQKTIKTNHAIIINCQNILQLKKVTQKELTQEYFLLWNV